MSKKILIGITGGIAAYKACSIINKLIKEGHDIKVIMTYAATKFVSPLTFQALTNHAVHADMFQTINKEEVEHVSLAKWADIMAIVPATANIIGKIANGIADDYLTTVAMALSMKTKIIFAPAMNSSMWENPIVQNNINLLKKIKDKYYFISPREGVLACRDKGLGKIATDQEILDEIKSRL